MRPQKWQEDIATFFYVFIHDGFHGCGYGKVIFILFFCLFKLFVIYCLTISFSSLLQPISLVFAFVPRVTS
jgi:hypothetical protein